MNYKGYLAKIEVNDELACFDGYVLGIKGDIHFRANDFEALEKEFHASVDEYLKVCKEHNLEPEKPYSGKFLLRINKDSHAKVAQKAKAKHKSLNAYVEDLIQQDLQLN